MTEQEQIDEMAKYICNACEMGHGFDGCSYGGREHYKRCSITQKTAKALYNVGYRKMKQAQIEEIAKFDKPCYDYNKLLYIIRCNMTSITRYVRNENEAYDIRYKELAEKAVENILKAINHRGEE